MGLVAGNEQLAQVPSGDRSATLADHPCEISHSPVNSHAL